MDSESGEIPEQSYKPSGDTGRLVLSHKTQKAGICGASGTGKSTFYYEFLRKCPHEWQFIFDFESEGLMRIDGIHCQTEDDLNEALKQPRARILYDPSIMWEGDNEAAFDFFTTWAFNIAKLYPQKKKIFATDELQTLIGTDLLPHGLTCILETGRRYRLDWLNIAQGFNLVHNRIRAQLTEIVAFRTQEARARQWLESVGFPEGLERLEDGEFYWRSLKTGQFLHSRIPLPGEKNTSQKRLPPKDDAIEVESSQDGSADEEDSAQNAGSAGNR